MYSIFLLHSLTFKAVMQRISKSCKFGKPLLHTHSTEQYYFKLVLFTTTRVSNTCRAVVASLVIPVLVVTCLASHCLTMLKLVRWLQTVRQNCSASLSSNNFLFLQENDSLVNRRLWLSREKSSHPAYKPPLCFVLIKAKVAKRGAYLRDTTVIQCLTDSYWVDPWLTSVYLHLSCYQWVCIEVTRSQPI